MFLFFLSVLCYLITFSYDHAVLCNIFWCKSILMVTIDVVNSFVASKKVTGKQLYIANYKNKVIIEHRIYTKDH